MKTALKAIMRLCRVHARPLSFSLMMLLLLSTSALAEADDWQQWVDYELDVTLVDAERSIEGVAGITYVNNSPDSLGAIWFRLPPAALRGDSPAENTLYRGRKRLLRTATKKEWGNLVVREASALDRAITFEQDGSIGRAILNPPLAPGDTAVFNLFFTTRFPIDPAQRRIGYEEGQYKGAYWYPMVCAYTPEEGWTVNRYYGSAEAYGEFGNFDIRYTVPYKYIVASTGELLNEADVLPAERLAGLAFDNPTPDPIPTGEQGDRLVTWHYFAEKVTDVAFAMAPDFLIDKKDFGTFQAWAFVRRGRQDGWNDATEILGWTIHQLESIYGPYPWPRVMMTDSWSGMEYPMLTMMSSKSPRYNYFLMHEVIHNYTPMIIHSSSVDAPVLDEGFTTFVEQVLIERYSKSKWNKITDIDRGIFRRSLTLRDDWERGRRPYLEAVLVDEDLPMVRGSDVADDYPLLRVSTYYKTPVMLNALRYVIGEDRFWAGMREYYRIGAFQHVDENDVIRAFSGAAGQPLGWFFKQFLYGDGDIDYALSGVGVEQMEQGWRIQFTISRKHEIRLPVRMAVVTESGDTLRGEISFLPTDPSLSSHERWGTWDQLHEPGSERQFEVTLKVSSKPVQFIIDPDDLLADRNPFDNRKPEYFPELLLDDGLFPKPPVALDRSQLSFGPVAGYGAESGAILGVNLKHSWLEQAGAWQVQAFAGTLDDESEVQWRAGYRIPLNEYGIPVRITLYGGSIKPYTWYEAGVLSNFRTWLPMERTLRLESRYGRLTENLATGDINSSDYYTVHLESAIPGLYGRSSRLFVDYASGIHGYGFYTLDVGYQSSWKLKRFPIPPWMRTLKRLDAGLEVRYLTDSKDVPGPFTASIGSGMRYQNLGSPFAGAHWGGREPRVDTPAQLAGEGWIDTEAEWLVSSKMVLELPIANLLDAPISTATQRLLKRFRLGMYQGLAVVETWTSLDGYFENGVEVTLKDMYGVTLTASLPLWKSSTHGSVCPCRFKEQPFSEELYFTVRLDPALFVR